LHFKIAAFNRSLTNLIALSPRSKQQLALRGSGRFATDAAILERRCPASGGGGARNN